MKIVATIEARMTSTRLPGKVLLKIGDETILSMLVKRIKSITIIDEIVLATTTNKSDDILEQFAISIGIKCYRGSENDVLNRVINAADSVNADLVVEITGDCPIIDPNLVEQTIRMFLVNNADYVSNSITRSYPDGMDTQVFKLSTLKQVEKMTNDPLDHEHVTLFIYNNPDLFKIINLIAPPDLFWPNLGLTLDEQSDYELIKKIVESLTPINPFFNCQDVISLLKANPEWVEINQSVKRKGTN
jgi:spore coat polysaccharide biosynthesis protein SpsF